MKIAFVNIAGVVCYNRQPMNCGFCGKTFVGRTNRRFCSRKCGVRNRGGRQHMLVGITQTLAAPLLGISRDRLKRLIAKGGPTIKGSRIDIRRFRAWMACHPELVNPPRANYANGSGEDDRPGVVYAIRCPSTRRIRYIGKSGDHRKRWREHRRDLAAGTHSSRHLQAWFTKSGVAASALIFEVLQHCLPGMMNAVEQEWIERSKASGDPLCNIREGGGGGRWTDEAKRRHSELCRPINQRLGIARAKVA